MNKFVSLRLFTKCPKYPWWSVGLKLGDVLSPFNSPDKSGNNILNNFDDSLRSFIGYIKEGMTHE